MTELINLLNNTGFEQSSQKELLASLQELDDDSDGFISRSELVQALTSNGEVLDKEEIDLLIKIATEPGKGQRDQLIDIKRIASVLLPDINGEASFSKTIEA